MNKLALILVLLAGASLLAVTVFRDPVAWAAQEVTATLTNVDADGNVKVREQGTVHVNGSLRTPPADAHAFGLHQADVRFARMDVSLIHLTMSDGCGSVEFEDGDRTTLSLFGPNTGVDGPRTITLPLAQPIRADRLTSIDVANCFVALTVAGTKVP